MAYDSFTIDTNAAIQDGLDLDSGLLGQLQQFKNGPIKLILSEIVIREIHKHLVQHIKKARDGLISAAAKAQDAELVGGEAAALLAAQVAELPDPRDVAGVRLKRFTDANGAASVPVKLASMDAVVRSYFGSRPPFEPTGAKKTEFPDAIALQSLEAWAEENEQKILVVSADKGWQAFAETSDHLDVETDFAKALAIVQEHAEAAQACVHQWLSAVDAGELPEAANDFEAKLTDALASWDFIAEGDGAFNLDVEATGLQFGAFGPMFAEDGYEVTIVRMGSNEIVAFIAGHATATASAEFSLSVWDGIDKEYVGMGSQSVEQEVEFDMTLLLTLSGNLDAGHTALAVDEVEVMDAVGLVDFGEIEMDYGDQDDDDYEAWLAQQADEPQPPEDNDGDF